VINIMKKFKFLKRNEYNGNSNTFFVKILQPCAECQ